MLTTRRARTLTTTAIATLALATTAAIAPAAQAKPDSPTSAPTTGACAFTPLEDQTYSTWVGLPPDPKNAQTKGNASVVLKTNHGDIPVVLDKAGAPCTVASFLYLTRQKYYDGTDCHRLTAYHTPPYALSVLQCGDPLGTGWAYGTAENMLHRAGVAPGDEGYPEDGAPAMATTIERAKRTGGL